MDRFLRYYSNMRKDQLTVTFGNYPERNIQNESDGVVGFSIEPPIEVHDPESLYRTARNLSPCRPWHRDNLKSVYFTHSTDRATYGRAVCALAMTSNNSSEYARNFREYLQKVFENTLNPTGEVEVNFIFLADNPEA